MSILIPMGLLMTVGIGIYQLKNPKMMWKISLGTVSVVTVIMIYNFMNIEDISTVNLNLFNGIGFSVNTFGILYSCIACILWIVSIITSLEYFSHSLSNLNRYYASLLVTLVGCIGVFLADDLYTLFIFFELMSFASYIWVAQNQDKKSTVASNSYLAFATIGGLVMLFGIFILNYLGKDLKIENLSNIFSNMQSEPLLYVACIMLLVGFGAKAGLFLLHDWLALAHTASPAPASGLLSGLLTKTGVYGIILITLKILPNSEIWAWSLLALGVCNMLFGAVFAFMSNDLKRTLAFSSVSQIGFILWGVSLSSILAEHNTYAVYGTIFHMINHSLIKIVLFSIAGIFYQNLHSLNLNDLQGFGRNKPWLKTLFAIGGMSLMGIPMLSGYISKTLLHESIVEYMHLHHVTGIYVVLEYLFLIAGGFTFAYMLKLFICLFVKKPNKDYEEKPYCSLKTKIAISCICFFLVLFGITANITFDSIGTFVSEFLGTHPFDHSVEYFSWTNLKGSLISISIGLFLYFIVAQKTVIKDGYVEVVNPKITIENYLYKPTIFMLSVICGLVSRVFDVLVDLVVFIVNRLFYKSAKIPQEFFDGSEKSDEHDSKVSITYSLAYSLLLFGIGLVFTICYLMITAYIN